MCQQTNCTNFQEAIEGIQKRFSLNFCAVVNHTGRLDLANKDIFKELLSKVLVKTVVHTTECPSQQEKPNQSKELVGGVCPLAFQPLGLESIIQHKVYFCILYKSTEG